MSKLEGRKWLTMLIASAIHGGASCAISALGLPVASAVGVDVKALDRHQLVGVLLAGALWKSITFLKGSPLPGIDGKYLDNGDTQTITKEQEK